MASYGQSVPSVAEVGRIAHRSLTVGMVQEKTLHPSEVKYFHGVKEIKHHLSRAKAQSRVVGKVCAHPYIAFG
ncbi:MAG: hypothetical protein ACO3XO_06810 [Bdellovibrionota bacterium]